jgi:type IV pilus assembly protein PilX
MTVQKYRQALKPGGLGSGSPNEKGSALIVSLIMLLLITLVAVAGMQTTIMQERMSANLYDRDLAFQAAEAALREGEALVSNGARPAIGDSHVYFINDADRPEWGGGNSTTNNSALEYSGTLDGVARQPEFFIEETPIEPDFSNLALGPPPYDPPYYRITARGFGGSLDTVVVVTSIVLVEY